MDEEHVVELPHSLEDALITVLPPTAYYIPDFITPAEEAFLLDKVRTYSGPHGLQPAL